MENRKYNRNVTIEKILVVAGSFNQFEHYLKENHLNKDNYRYVRGLEDLLGYTHNSVEVMFVGTWFKRKDIEVDMIKYIARNKLPI